MPTTIYQNLKILALLQAAVGLVAALAVGWLSTPERGVSFAVGAGLMLANLLVLAWTSWRALAKKSIAWTSLIIVLKYAVLLGSIWYLSRTSWFNSLWAGLGVTTFVIAALIAAIIIQKKEDNDSGSSSL